MGTVSRWYKAGADQILVFMFHRTMSSPIAGKSTEARPYRLDKVAVRRAFDRAAHSPAEEHPVTVETARRMAERLDYVRLDPGDILDAGCGRMAAAPLLAKRFPAARLTGVDTSFQMVKAARVDESLLTRARVALGMAFRPRVVCADIESMPIADAGVDMVWSNLALAWVQDAGLVFREFHRVLKDGGLLMFSTFGPDTLRELRLAFATVEKSPHVHEFIDMHDLGDLLLANGFADPVMDMEKIVYSYADVFPMVRELKNSGQTNALMERRRGLTGRSAWNAMLAAYARREGDGRIDASFEIVHGHAWKAGLKHGKTEAVSGIAKIQWLPDLKRKPQR